MTETAQQNMATLQQLNLLDLDSCAELFSDDSVWHYFNNKLPEPDGAYRGVDGLKTFFAKLQGQAKGSFKVNVVDARPAGDELVVTQVCNRIVLDGNSSEFDAIVVWRIVDSKVAEAWDIPAVHTMRFD